LPSTNKTANYLLNQYVGGDSEKRVDYNSDMSKIDLALKGLEDGKIQKSLITAANDFLVGSGASTAVKKTLAETKTILGINAATTAATGVVQLATAAEVTTGTDAAKVVTPATAKVELDKKVNLSLFTAANDFLVGSGASTAVKKTVAEIKTILSLDLLSNYINQNEFKKFFTLPAFSTSIANQKVKISFPVTASNSFAGIIKVRIGGDYASTNQAGILEKTSSILADGSTITQQSSYTSIENLGANEFRISDWSQNGTNIECYIEKSVTYADMYRGFVEVEAICTTQSLIAIAQVSLGSIYVSDLTVLPVPVLQSRGKEIDLIGRIDYIPFSTVPYGYLKCNGATVSRTTYSNLFAKIGTIYGGGDGSTTFNLPDLRGVFVRGLDESRGLDSGRTLGSYQDDELKAHAHGMIKSNLNNGNDTTTSGLGQTASGAIAYTQISGGAETRPKNIALMAIIKY